MRLLKVWYMKKINNMSKERGGRREKGRWTELEKESE